MYHLLAPHWTRMTYYIRILLFLHGVLLYWGSRMGSVAPSPILESDKNEIASSLFWTAGWRGCWSQFFLKFRDDGWDKEAVGVALTIYLHKIDKIWYCETSFQDKSTHHFFYTKSWSSRRCPHTNLKVLTPCNQHDTLVIRETLKDASFLSSNRNQYKTVLNDTLSL